MPCKPVVTASTRREEENRLPVRSTYPRLQVLTHPCLLEGLHATLQGPDRPPPQVTTTQVVVIGKVGAVVPLGWCVSRGPVRSVLAPSSDARSP